MNLHKQTSVGFHNQCAAIAKPSSVCDIMLLSGRDVETSAGSAACNLPEATITEHPGSSQ